MLHFYKGKIRIVESLIAYFNNYLNSSTKFLASISLKSVCFSMF